MNLCSIALLLALGGSLFTNPGVAETPSGKTHATAAVSAIWIDVPFAAQTKDGCGSASIAMVMRYWDVKRNIPFSDAADPAKIQELLFSRSASGIFASSMQKYFQDSGYQA
ncbi:MAG: C39 family peptidase, partial [Acidobacteriaceae bacterium]